MRVASEWMGLSRGRTTVLWMILPQVSLLWLAMLPLERKMGASRKSPQSLLLLPLLLPPTLLLPPLLRHQISHRHWLQLPAPPLVIPLPAQGSHNTR